MKLISHLSTHMWPLIEICVGSIEDAVTARNAGADRIELCSALETGGLTPPLAAIEQACALDIPVFPIIRPRAGDFVYTAREIDCMQRDIAHAVEAGAAGVVFGALTRKRALDLVTLDALICAAGEVPVTLHRAFDDVADPFRALDEAKALRFTRILTSGLAPTAIDGIPLLTRLFAAAGEDIILLPGGGITPWTVHLVLSALPARELHASCKTSVTRSDATCASSGLTHESTSYRTDGDQVRNLLRAVKRVPLGAP